MDYLFRLPPFKVESLVRPADIQEVIDWGLATNHIPHHWKETSGKGVKVAVLDTGIDSTHPDLADAIDDARDFTGSPFGPGDVHGHGTHTAGTIAARRNGKGVVGVAPDARLLIAKVLGDDGSGLGDWVAAGIDWACDQGAKLINMSLGSPFEDPKIKRAVDRAYARNVAIIAAAGNDGRPNSVGYPAFWDQCIAVAAVDREGRLCDFSSRGDQVDIAAPGQEILSTFKNGGYAKLSGTSMATPFVAGVAALAIALRPLLSPAHLLQKLTQTAMDAGPVGRDSGYGWGLISPDSILATEPEPPSPSPPTSQPAGVTIFIPGAKVI